MFGRKAMDGHSTIMFFFSCRVVLCLVFGFVLDGESFVLLYGDVHGSQEHGEAQDCLKMSFFGRSDRDHSTLRTIV